MGHGVQATSPEASRVPTGRSRRAVSTWTVDCGGGDAKLFTACALWLGLPGLLPFLAFTGLTGGVLAAGLIAARNGIIGAYAASGPAWLGRLLTVDEDLPYGLAIAVGALAAFPSSALVAAAARV